MTNTDNMHSQGRAQYASIKEMVDALQAARASYGYDHDSDAEQAIMEDPLSVRVRGDWREPGDTSGATPCEYELLLCTGGPACRILGDLDVHGQPTTAVLQVQDWGVVWTPCLGLPEDAEETMLAYASVFYFGE